MPEPAAPHHGTSTPPPLITQLRRTMRRTGHRADPGGQAHLPASDTRRDRQAGPAGPQTRPQS
jgi:hypothetical protein